MNPTKVLAMPEIQEVLAYNRKRKNRYPGTRLNLVIFRLSCCCGMRCREISDLDLGDVDVDSSVPVVTIRKEIAKSKRQRIIPLDLDKGCLEDIREWVEIRRGHGALPDSPFVCSLRKDRLGDRLSRRTVFNHWKTAVRCLGTARVAQISTHVGRHSFCTHAIRAGFSLAEVREWAGHQSVKTLDVYYHALRTDIGKDLFS